MYTYTTKFHVIANFIIEVHSCNGSITLFFFPFIQNLNLKAHKELYFIVAAIFSIVCVQLTSYSSVK